MRHPAFQLAAVRGFTACLFALQLTGCAARSLDSDPLPTGTTPRVTVRVVNECSDIVRVYYVADAGWRVRLATVGPLQSGVFSSRLIADQPGRFVTMRIASAERPTSLVGSVDPLLIGNRVVHLTVGGTPEFDRWSLRK